MPKASAIASSWKTALRAASRARGLRFVSEVPFAIDAVYISELETRIWHPNRDEELLRITWSVRIKPLALDDILWEAFLPDVEMSPRMRINRRINGAFQVQSAEISTGEIDVPADSPIDWTAALDDFERSREEFIDRYPDAASFAVALTSDLPRRGSPTELVQTLTALIAAGRSAEASALADDAIDRGERGPMGSAVDVLKYLAAFAKGPATYRDFLASLEPTHLLEVLFEKEPRRNIVVKMIRAHYRGNYLRDLGAMDGSDPWAVILTDLREDSVRADEEMLYLQAAGTAERMTVEVCRRGGADVGAESVRSVVGRPSAQTAITTEALTLPRSTEQVFAEELFTAEEAAHFFDSFYRDGHLGAHVSLRPAEGYSSGSSPIDLRGRASVVVDDRIPGD
ncbi:hypothetical protein [Microbacterium phyllosphaerae]